jgi:hypothetical protein
MLKKLLAFLVLLMLFVPLIPLTSAEDYNESVYPYRYRNFYPQND